MLNFHFKITWIPRFIFPFTFYAIHLMHITVLGFENTLGPQCFLALKIQSGELQGPTIIQNGDWIYMSQVAQTIFP